MSVSIVCELIIGDDVPGEVSFDPAAVSAYAGRVLDTCGVSDGQVNLVVIGDAAMARMNEEYRGKTGPTDILSFDLSEPDSDTLEGELYISLDRVHAQAVEYCVTGEEEFIRLVTHGLLHLCGRTHGNDDDYRTMMEETDRLMTLFRPNGEASS